jgi:hypothetical protein
VLPLAASAAFALIGGDFRELVLSAGLFLLFMLGATATRQDLRREDAFARRSLARAGWIPLKGIGAGLVALASGLSAYLAAGHGLRGRATQRLGCVEAPRRDIATANALISGPELL